MTREEQLEFLEYVKEFMRGNVKCYNKDFNYDFSKEDLATCIDELEGPLHVVDLMCRYAEGRPAELAMDFLDSEDGLEIQEELISSIVTLAYKAANDIWPDKTGQYDSYTPEQIERDFETLDQDYQDIYNNIKTIYNK